MQIADQVEEVGGQGKGWKIYTGIENFHPVAVNPTMAELNEMGIPATQEPTYFGKTTRNVQGEEKELDYFSVRVFLENDDADNQVKTQVQYTVLADYTESSTGKYMVINKYGSTTWFEPEVVDGNKAVPDNMQWYVTDGVKKCYKGEEALISFIRCLRNLPNITSKTAEKDKSKGISVFTEDDLNKMFRGDFNDIRRVIMESKDNKVGYLLGAKKLDDSKNVQALYARMPLKAYVKHAPNSRDYNKLIESVTQSQQNGSYSDTSFDLNDTTLKEYVESEVNNYDGATVGVGVQDDDDLPF